LPLWHSVCKKFSPSRKRFAQYLLVRRSIMNWDQIKGNWKQFTGRVKQKWGKLTDDDLTTIAGKRDELVGKLQERYGIEKDKAERELDDFTRSLNE
jgi:uncharacterized protein YjbJ (UPF0337 family)